MASASVPTLSETSILPGSGEGREVESPLEHVAEEILNFLLCHYEPPTTNEEHIKAAKQASTRFFFHFGKVESPQKDDTKLHEACCFESEPIAERQYVL